MECALEPSVVNCSVRAICRGCGYDQTDRFAVRSGLTLAGGLHLAKAGVRGFAGTLNPRRSAFFVGPGHGSRLSLAETCHCGFCTWFIRNCSLLCEPWASTAELFFCSTASSPLLPLVIIWIVLIAVQRPRLDWERAALLCGIGFGLISYVVQARGYPYYRYPLLVFLLPLMAMDFTTAWYDRRQGDWLRRSASSQLQAFLTGALIIAPMSSISDSPL